MINNFISSVIISQCRNQTRHLVDENQLGIKQPRPLCFNLYLRISIKGKVNQYNYSYFLNLHLVKKIIIVTVNLRMVAYNTIYSFEIVLVYKKIYRWRSHFFKPDQKGAIGSGWQPRLVSNCPVIGAIKEGGEVGV